MSFGQVIYKNTQEKQTPLGTVVILISVSSLYSYTEVSRPFCPLFSSLGSSALFIASYKEY